MTTPIPSINLAMLWPRVLPNQNGRDKAALIDAEIISNIHKAASGRRALFGRIGFFNNKFLIKTNEFQKRDSPI